MNNSQSLLQTVQSSLISERIILGGGGYVCEVNLHPSMRLLISEAE